MTNLSHWETQADKLIWKKKWEKTLDWQLPHAKWFLGGTLNASENCLDKHLNTPTENKLALIWENENGDKQKITYLELHKRVCEFSAVLRNNGVAKGDRVAIYMPLIPEAIIAMQACARIGAIHTVIFAGFSAESIQNRIIDSGCSLIITADGTLRRGKILELRKTLDNIDIKKIITFHHLNLNLNKLTDQNLDWDQETSKLSQTQINQPIEHFDSEHPLFILYTSGTTGKPKGIVHSTGGYLSQVSHSTSSVFDLKDSDIYWCTADIGWITGHSYVCYGPLSQGTTIFLYEGVFNYPNSNRFWKLIQDYKISILYTAPTAIRTLMQDTKEPAKDFNLSSLRMLGTVGEPINPKAWHWFKSSVGQDKCPIIDTWWQTETGSIMIAPDLFSTKISKSNLKALPGLNLDIVDKKGQPVKENTTGYLVSKDPWPSMARNIWGDSERFKKTYFSQIKNSYFTGDAAKKDINKNFSILGRVDDVLNISGHRIGTAEVEAALSSHNLVAEAAVIAKPDKITGESICAFVVINILDNQNNYNQNKLISDLKLCVSNKIGSFAKPSEIKILETLPKTRSGKIMRRLLRELAIHGEFRGDTSTLDN